VDTCLGIDVFDGLGLVVDVGYLSLVGALIKFLRRHILESLVIDVESVSLPKIRVASLALPAHFVFQRFV